MLSDHGLEVVFMTGKTPRRGTFRDSLDAYFFELSRVELLTAAKELELARRVAEGDLAARDELMQANLRLVVSVARRYQHRGLPLGDLVQEGNLGLMTAIRKFDHRLGNRFSTYACWWIRQAVSRAVSDNGRTVRMPVHMQELFHKILGYRRETLARCGREPTVEELAQKLSVREKRIRETLDAARDPISLDIPMGADGASLSDVVPGADETPPEKKMNRKTQESVADGLLSVLESREERIVRMRYGVGGIGDLNLTSKIDPDAEDEQELATQDRIRQLEAELVNRMVPKHMR